jgi:ribosome-associated protein
VRKLTDILREEAKEDPRDLRSRTDDRKVRVQSETELTALAKRLVALSKKQFERLEVPPTVADSVVAARTITSSIALDRQLRIVRRQLRGSDTSALALALEDLEAGRVAPRGKGDTDEVDSPARQWFERLVARGDEEIQQFLEAYPAANRQELRQLVRTARGVKDARRQTAEKKLEEWLRAVTALSDP